MVAVFISHSSKDKALARQIANDLVAAKIKVWLDEWDILVGDSITQRIQHGLGEADFVAVLLTKHAVSSGWVEKEWQSQVGVEAETRKVVILPLKADECSIPVLLRDKRHADFQSDYSAAVKQLIEAVKGHASRKQKRDPTLALEGSPAGMGVKGGYVQLLAQETHYSIPQGDDNRNIIRKIADGTPQRVYSYSIVSVSIVLEAISSWTVHDCKLLLFNHEYFWDSSKDTDSWHALTLFGPQNTEWPLTDRWTKEALTQANSYREDPPALTNTTGLSIDPGRAVKLTLRGWLRTASSLNREVQYPALLFFHINTQYIGFVIRLFELRDASILGYRTFVNSDNAPLEGAKGWATALLRAESSDSLVPIPGKLRIEGV